MPRGRNLASRQQKCCIYVCLSPLRHNFIHIWNSVFRCKLNMFGVCVCCLMNLVWYIYTVFWLICLGLASALPQPCRCWLGLGLVKTASPTSLAGSRNYRLRGLTVNRLPLYSSHVAPIYLDDQEWRGMIEMITNAVFYSPRLNEFKYTLFYTNTNVQRSSC